MKQSNNITAPTENEERKKVLRVTFFKMTAIIAFVVIIAVFSSMHMPIKQMTAETA